MSKENKIIFQLPGCILLIHLSGAGRKVISSNCSQPLLRSLTLTLLNCPANHPDPHQDPELILILILILNPILVLFILFYSINFCIQGGIWWPAFYVAFISGLLFSPWLDWIGSDAFTEKYQQIGLSENGLSAILESSPLLITLPGAYEGINLFWGKLRNFHQSWSTSPRGGTKTQL